MRRLRRARRRRMPGALGLTAALVAAVLVGAWGVTRALERWDVPAPLGSESCAAQVGGTSWTLSPTQADNAALIAAVALRRGLPARAATIGIATALQESKLENIDYGDRDSLGLFQQRPSQGWGTQEQIMDPVYATNAFYDVLIKIEGYTDLPVTDAAQRVQRSAFPDAYAQHEARARAFASALTGYSPGALGCSLRPATGAGSATAVTDRLARDLGDVPTTTETRADGGGTVLVADAGALTGEPDQRTRLGWALAQWAVALAQPLAITQVQTADRTWTRDGDAWAPSDALTAGQVRITLAAG